MTVSNAWRSMLGVLWRAFKIASPVTYVLVFGTWALIRADIAAGDVYGYFNGASIPGSPYLPGAAYGTSSIFVYSPAFAQALAPLAALGWQVFLIAWTLLLLGVLLVIAREWAFPIMLFPIVYPWETLLPAQPLAPGYEEVATGNIHLLIAAALLLAYRWPAVWSFMLLTKPTLGVGLLWYVVRREWRNLGVALATTAVIALASMALVGPAIWVDWIRLMLDALNGRTIVVPVAIVAPLALRLAVAAAIVVWGARTNRRWVLPIALLCALPVIWAEAPILLVALVPDARRAFGPRVASLLVRRPPTPAVSPAALP